MYPLKLAAVIFAGLFLVPKSARSFEIEFIDHQLVSTALANPQSRYNKVLSQVAPFVLRKMYGTGSATIVAKSNDGQGLVLTALHTEMNKFPHDQEMLGLKESSDWAFELQPILRADKSPVDSFISEFLDPKNVIPVLGGFTIYSPKVDLTPSQVNSSLFPRSDFALIALPQVGAWYWATDPQNNLPSQLPGKYSPEPLKSISSIPLGIADPEVGTEAVLVGFPKSNTPDLMTQNPLEVRNGQTYSTGRILSDSEANEFLKNVEGSEKLLPYDGSTEFLVLGRASVGFSGGGAFDMKGKYLGILVRAGKSKDGSGYVRVVRARYVLSQAVDKIKEMTDIQNRDMTLRLIPEKIVKTSNVNFCKSFYH